MTERERKMMAFLAGLLRKMAWHDSALATPDEWQQLDNICDELGLDDLDGDEFRY